MGSEQEAPLAVHIDTAPPIIDNTGDFDKNREMVVPGGDPNAGSIDVVETTPGINNSRIREVWEDPAEEHEVAVGIPVIGAATEELKRQINKNSGVADIDDIRKYAQRTGVEDAIYKANELEVSDASPDEAGEKAMIALLQERIKTSKVYKQASDKLKEELLKEAETSFRKDQEKKLTERQKQFDAAAQEVIDKLKNGEPLEKVIPETVVLDGGEQTTTVPDKVDIIDATPDLSPVDEETGDWKPEHIGDSNQPQ
jgi:hypothetical protein